MTEITRRRVMMTGGHVTPAIATIQAIRTHQPDWDIVFVGRRVALEGEKILSEEYRLITAMHMPFFPVTAGRWKREGGLAALAALVKVPVGFAQALWYVWQNRPDIIVSFGGYVALPVVIAGWMLRVPIVTHEQTRKPGLANRIISKLAARTCVSFPDRDGSFHSNVIQTGLPIRDSLFHPPASPTFLLPKEKRPIIFIAGGSTGSTSVNTVVYETLPMLLKTYTVIHQAGRISLSRAREIKRQLTRDKDHYVVLPFLSESDYSWTLHTASLFVGRSGANTVFEIGAVGQIALFIPLPWSANNEQFHNASFLKEEGTAEILIQRSLSAESLYRQIHNFMKQRTERVRRAKDVAATIPRDGAMRLTRIIGECMQ